MTNKNIETECTHELLRSIGWKDNIHLGDCYDCHETRQITVNYRHVTADVYELSPIASEEEVNNGGWETSR